MDVVITPLETTVAITPLEMAVYIFNLHQIVLHQQHIVIIGTTTLEMDVVIFFSKEQQQEVIQFRYRTITSHKDYKVHQVNTSLLME